MSDFSFETLEDFDGHVRSQLPWYDIAWEATANVIKGFAQPSTTVYDIGSSTGYGYRKLKPLIEQRSLTYVGIEPSQHLSQHNDGDTVEADATSYPFTECSVAISFLSSIFMTVPKRKQMFENIADQLAEGGAFIILERTTATGGALGLAFNRSIQAMKDRKEGYDNFGKEVELLGIQQPLDLDELKVFNFREFKPFFRCFDFVGAVGIK